MATNAANDTGLKHIWDKLIAKLALKVDKETGKGLSTNDYTTAEKSKLAGMEAGAQVNTVSSVAGKTGVVSLDKSDVGLGNVPNVTTDNQEPTVTEASTRVNIATGDTLKTIIGKIKKFFSDLKAVAFTGEYSDLSGTPTIPTKISDLTDDVVAGNYLSKNGGTVGAGTVATPLEIKGTSEAWVKFIKSDGTTLGWIGVNQSGQVTFYDSAGHILAYKSDLSSYLPLTGGSLTGNLNVSGSSDTSLYTHGNESGSYIGFRNQSGNTTFGYIGVKNGNLPCFYANNTSYDLVHAIELTGTLEAGSTTLTLSNSAITTSSVIDVYTDKYGISPTDVTVSSGSIVLTFDAQSSALSVKVRVS